MGARQKFQSFIIFPTFLLSHIWYLGPKYDTYVCRTFIVTCRCYFVRFWMPQWSAPPDLRLKKRIQIQTEKCIPGVATSWTRPWVAASYHIRAGREKRICEGNRDQKSKKWTSPGLFHRVVPLSLRVFPAPRRGKMACMWTCIWRRHRLNWVWMNLRSMPCRAWRCVGHGSCVACLPLGSEHLLFLPARLFVMEMSESVPSWWFRDWLAKTERSLFEGFKYAIEIEVPWSLQDSISVMWNLKSDDLIATQKPNLVQNFCLTRSSCHAILLY